MDNNKDEGREAVIAGELAMVSHAVDQLEDSALQRVLKSHMYAKERAWVIRAARRILHSLRRDD